MLSVVLRIPAPRSTALSLARSFSSASPTSSFAVFAQGSYHPKTVPSRGIGSLAKPRPDLLWNSKPVSGSLPDVAVSMSAGASVAGRAGGFFSVPSRAMMMRTAVARRTLTAVAKSPEPGTSVGTEGGKPTVGNGTSGSGDQGNAGNGASQDAADRAVSLWLKGCAGLVFGMVLLGGATR